MAVDQIVALVLDVLLLVVLHDQAAVMARGLEAVVLHAEVEVLLGEQMVSLKTIMGLEVGETLQLSSKPEDQMILRCGDTPLMRGKVGRVGDKMAVMVDEWLSQADRRVGGREKGI